MVAGGRRDRTAGSRCCSGWLEVARSEACCGVSVVGLRCLEVEMEFGLHRPEVDGYWD